MDPAKVPPVVSVVVPTFNPGPDLEPTLDSALGQTFSEFESLVIDGGSTDGTVETLRRFGDRIECWISEPDRGVYDVYNKGIDLSPGGFSPLYAPFYVEDMDLSYQAWKRGWKSVMAPEATVWHPVNSTIRRYHRQRKIKYLIGRNKHFFLWANITDPLLVLRYFLCLIPSLVWDVVSFRKYKFVGMFMALERISEVMRERKARKPHAVRSDREIIRCVKLRN